MEPFTRMTELWDWLVALPPDFAFLLALPVFVACAALFRGGIDRIRQTKCPEYPTTGRTK